MARATTLRSRFTVISAVGVALALALAAALVLLTSQARQRADEMVDAVEAVRLVQRVELDVYLAARAVDPVVRADRVEAMRTRLDRAADHVTSADERVELAEAAAAVEAFVATIGRDRLDERQRAAVAALEEVIAINLEQARTARADVRRVDAIANAIAVAAALVMVGALATVVLWLRRRAFQPMMSFLGAVAHDLRNPVGTMRIAVELLDPARPPPDEPRLRRTLATFDRQLRALDRMIGDLLDVARIEAGQLELRVEPVELAPLVERATAPFASVSPRHHVRVEVAAEPCVSADPVRIEQVIGNLVSNAIKYAPGGGDVRVRVDLDDARGDAIVAVTDPGIGMTEEEQARLFAPFERLGRRAAAGTGLGLYLARRIVEAHGGSIHVRSRPGEGSTFEIRLAGA